MLFKRAILEASMEFGIPIVILADEYKIPYEFKTDKCFPICDGKELIWDAVCRDVPIAIACAFRTDKRANEVMEKLGGAGLTHRELERGGQSPWCAMMSNDRFWSVRANWIRSSAQFDTGGGLEIGADTLEDPVDSLNQFSAAAGSPS
jgi:hypothetical protein